MPIGFCATRKYETRYKSLLRLCICESLYYNRCMNIHHECICAKRRSRRLNCRSDDHDTKTKIATCICKRLRSKSKRSPRCKSLKHFCVCLKMERADPTSPLLFINTRNPMCKASSHCHCGHLVNVPRYECRYHGMVPLE